MSETDAFFIPHLQDGMIGLSFFGTHSPTRVLGADGVVLHVDAHGPDRAWAAVLRKDGIHSLLLARDKNGWREERRREFRLDAINFSSSRSAFFGWRVDMLTGGGYETTIERVQHSGEIDRMRFSGFGIGLMPIRSSSGFIFLVTEQDRAYLRYWDVQAQDKEFGIVHDLVWESGTRDWFAFLTDEGWHLVLNDGSVIRIGGRPIDVGRQRNGDALWLVVKIKDGHTAIEHARSGGQGTKAVQFAKQITGLAWLDPQTSQLASLSWEDQGWNLQVRSAADPSGRGTRVELDSTFATPEKAALSFKDGSLHGFWIWGNGRLDWIYLNGTQADDVLSLNLDIVALHPLRSGIGAFIETQDEVWFVRTSHKGLKRLGPVRFSIDNLPFGPRQVWMHGSVLWAQGWSSVLAMRPQIGGAAAVLREGAHSSLDGVVELRAGEQSVMLRVPTAATTIYHQASRDDGEDPSAALSRMPDNVNVTTALSTLEQSDIKLHAWLQRKDGTRIALESRSASEANEWSLRPAAPHSGFESGEIHYVWRDAGGAVLEGVVPITVLDSTPGMLRLWMSLHPFGRGIVYGLVFGFVFIGVAWLLVSGGVGRGFIGWIAAVAIPALGVVLNESIPQVDALTISAVPAFMVVLVFFGAFVPHMRTTLCDTQPFATLVPVMLLSERFRRSVLACAADATKERAGGLPGIRDLPIIPVPLQVCRGHSLAESGPDPLVLIVSEAFTRHRRGVVVLEGHGGTGKSTLMREAILTVLGQWSSNSSGGADTRPTRGGWTLPVLISAPDKDKLVANNSLAVLVRNSLMRWLPTSIVDALIERGDLTVCIDGAESWPKDLLDTWNDRGASRLSFLIATRVSSGSIVFRGVDAREASSTVTVYTSDWDEATLSRFLDKVGKNLSKGLWDACRRDGRYSPLLAAIALQVPEAESAESKDQLYSRAIHHFLGNSAADPDLALRSVSSWAFEHYSIAGTRLFRAATLRKSLDGTSEDTLLVDAILKSALLVEDTETGLLRFIHDDLLAYVVCHHLRSLRSDEWISIFDRFFRSPAFHDAPVEQARPSSQIAMCCSVLTPTTDLAHALIEVAKRWKQDHGDHLTLSQVSPLDDCEHLSGNPGEFLVQTARSEANSDNMMRLAAYLEHVARKQPGLPEPEDIYAN